ncbi:ester cyclase [Streptomyces sp. SID13666]|uniref:ester cyclase n=1 Tax=unclassified Streptomyces TaxID=2593676 RepID=UPI0013C293E3|nr:MULTISPECIES: ester cyclase [unclassified Streptomyces]NEA57823.1 ester cyclase [Streptomyces sp. SID13666]NEA75663.1 ester cyclase [Streptomyces sp. SID13588]
MQFTQIIDFKTDQFDDMNQLMDRWVEQTKGKRTASHSVIGKDRADASHYVEIVEFPSYEEAMKNSQLPETERIFQEMVALCDGMPTFTDLDVVRDEQLNKAACRRFFEEIANDGNLDAIEEIFAADYRDHDPNNETPTMGTAALREEVAGYRAGFDFRFTIDDQLAEGDCVANRWTWTATHVAEFRGMPATDRQARMTGQTVFRFQDGMIVEAWWNHDMLGLLTKLGVIEMPH